jgi:proteasome lid subunit RPN8/RPN11
MNIIDSVLDDMRSQLASQAPERGGALFGPKGRALVTHFEYDALASTSAVSYIPSTRLIDNVARVERETGLEFKGIVHSHPPGFAHPSTGDERTMASFFRLNPHIASVALPIVQQASSANGNRPGDFIHWFRAERRAMPPRMQGFPHLGRLDDDIGVAVIQEDLHIVPLSEHLLLLLQMLERHGISLSRGLGLQQIATQGSLLFGFTAGDGQDHEFMYFAGVDYPVVAPVVLYLSAGATNSLQFEWDGLMEDAAVPVARIAQALLKQWFVAGSGISRVRATA